MIADDYDDQYAAEQPEAGTVAKGFTIVDDGGNNLGGDGTADAVSRHNDTGIPSDILMKPL